MLESSDTFLTIAEIAATFAGFSAVINALGDRGAGAKHDVMRLRLVITTSVLVVAVGLLPIAAAGFDFDPGLLWRFVSAIYLVLIIAIGYSFVTAYQSVRGNFPPDVFAVVWSLTLLAITLAALLTILFGLAPSHSTGLYTTALICVLGIAALVFIRLVNSTFNPQNLE